MSGSFCDRQSKHPGDFTLAVALCTASLVHPCGSTTFGQLKFHFASQEMKISVQVGDGVKSAILALLVGWIKCTNVQCVHVCEWCMCVKWKEHVSLADTWCRHEVGWPPSQENHQHFRGTLEAFQGLFCKLREGDFPSNKAKMKRCLKCKLWGAHKGTLVIVFGHTGLLWVFMTNTFNKMQKAAKCKKKLSSGRCCFVLGSLNAREARGGDQGTSGHFCLFNTDKIYSLSGR